MLAVSKICIAFILGFQRAVSYNLDQEKGFSICLVVKVKDRVTKQWKPILYDRPLASLVSFVSQANVSTMPSLGREACLGRIGHVL